MATRRPYRHVRWEAGFMSSAHMVILGIYATLGAAVRAAKAANAIYPDGTRQIRRGRQILRDTYNHGPVATWREGE